MVKPIQSGFQEPLIQWYRKNKRELPWRKTRNPYYIWVSEVMLQQTQVDTVIPYYERFIAQFPTMHELARAPEETVLKAWEGLGYYSRARNLQSGVQEVVEQYKARIPSQKKDLLSVKGIGPYTAGAILSIAFNKEEPAVDGNVMRVMARIFLIGDDIAKQKTRRFFENLLSELIPVGHASDFNQALMELGALICKPRQPLCHACPVAAFCEAKQKNVVQEYPVKTKKINQKTVRYAAVVLYDHDSHYFIQKRPADGLLANLWEFPLVAIAPDQDMLETVSEAMRRDYRVHPDLKKTDQTVTHTFTHLKWNLNIVLGETDHLPGLELGRSVTKEELPNYPFPVPQQKIIGLLDELIDGSSQHRTNG